jgi:hypothetical protein
MTIGDLMNAFTALPLDLTIGGEGHSMPVAVVTKNGKEIPLKGFRMVTSIPADGGVPFSVFQILGT